MSAIAWWVIPLVATFVAIAFVTWRARPGPPEDTHDAMEARERFRKAIESGSGGSRRNKVRAKGDDGDDAADRA